MIEQISIKKVYFVYRFSVIREQGHATQNGCANVIKDKAAVQLTGRIFASFCGMLMSTEIVNHDVLPNRILNFIKELPRLNHRWTEYSMLPHCHLLC